MVAITSSGNRVTFLWTCSRLSTRARTTPTEKSTRLLCTRWWCQVMAWLLPSLRPPAPALRSPREGSASGALWATSRDGPDTDEVIISPTLAASPPAPAPGEPRCLARLAQEQLQQWSCSLGISPRSLTGFPRRRRTGRRDHDQVHLQGAGQAQESVRASREGAGRAAHSAAPGAAPARTASPPQGDGRAVLPAAGRCGRPALHDPLHTPRCRPPAPKFPGPRPSAGRPGTSHWGPPGGGTGGPANPGSGVQLASRGCGRGRCRRPRWKAASPRERG